MQAEDVVVGRTPKCTVRVVHPLVSREHCRFEVRSDGIWVADLASVNGTWLNGTRVGERTRVIAGDRIGLGRDGAVLTVKRALVDGSDVAQLPREEDMKTMVAGDPRALGAVARVEVSPDALPALGVADEPTTRAVGDANRAAIAAALQKPAAAQPAAGARPGPSGIPVMNVFETSEVRPPAPLPSDDTTGRVAPVAAPPRATGFWPGIFVGVVLGLAAVAAVAKFTGWLEPIRGRLAEAVR